MKTFDRVLVLALTLALSALAIGQVTRASAQDRFQVTRGFKEAIERVVDEYYVGNLINDTCYVTNGDVQDGHKDDVSYVHC